MAVQPFAPPIKPQMAIMIMEDIGCFLRRASLGSLIADTQSIKVETRSFLWEDTASMLLIYLLIFKGFYFFIAVFSS